MALAWDTLRCLTHHRECRAALHLILERSMPTGTRCVAALPSKLGFDLTPWLGADDVAAHFDLPALHAADIPPRWRVLAALIGDRPALLRALDQGLAAGLTEDADALIVRLWQAGGSSWLEGVAALPAMDQIRLLRLLPEKEKLPPLPRHALVSLFAALNRKVPPKERARMLRWLLKGLVAGGHPGFMSAALRLTPVVECRFFIQRVAVPTSDHAVSGNSLLRLQQIVSPIHLLRLWRACGEVRGLDGLLGSIKALRHVCRSCLHTFVNCLISQVHSTEPRLSLERTQQLLQYAQKVRFSGFCGWVGAIRLELTQKTRPAPHVVASLCEKAEGWARKEAQANDATSLWGALRAKLGSDAHLDAAIDHPGARKAMQTAFRSWIKESLAQETVDKMRKEDVAMLMPALNHAPSCFCAALTKLASVPEKRLAAVMTTAAEHPLFACVSQMQQPASAVSLLESMWRERCKTNPLPLRLMLYVKQDRPLAKHLLDHDMAGAKRGWCEAQMHLLEELASDEVRRAFPGLPRDACIQDHTLWVALSSEHNTRPMRRVIRAISSGDADWHRRHPSNQKWLANLPPLIANRWCEDIIVTRQVGKLGPVTVRPEHDPQEVLRMGTLVHSCLSAGSFNTHGAIANMLDANKRLLYARNAAGRIVGRQLLALSTTGSLVRFRPYPYDLPTALLSFFDDYDRVLARHLGIPLHKSEEYEVEDLVAKQWYDDGNWPGHKRF
jgi:hypothetical protein